MSLRGVNLVIIGVAVFTVSCLQLSAQADYGQFYDRSLSTTTSGMYVLGSWAVINIAAGGYGWLKNDGERKYFSQMNLFWNLVNLSIAGFAIINNSQTDLSLMSGDEMMNKHLGTERLLLINAGLDIAYIGTGILMSHFSSRSSTKADLFKGYGNSIILQGSFLFVFDAVLYGILRNQKVEFLRNMEIDFSSQAVMLNFGINF